MKLRHVAVSRAERRLLKKCKAKGKEMPLIEPASYSRSYCRKRPSSRSKK